MTTFWASEILYLIDSNNLISPVQAQPSEPLSTAPIPPSPKPKFPISFILLGLVIIAATIFTVQYAKTYLSLQKQVDQMTHIPSVLTPTAIAPSPTLSPVTNWKTYTNKIAGYEIKYPNNWFAYIQSLYELSKNSTCNLISNDNSPLAQNPSYNMVEFSKTELKDCSSNPTPPSEISIITYHGEDTTYKLSNEKHETINLGGVEAYKFPYNKQSTFSSDLQITNIFFVNNSYSYIFYLKHFDQQESYNPIYDQILSTFKFLPTSTSNANILVSLTTEGGLCPSMPCYSPLKKILTDGTITVDEKTKGKLSASELSTLTNLIATTDFTKIKAAPTRDICATAMDGAEFIYTFQNSIELRSCSVNIDPTDPLFKKVDELFANYQ